MTKCVGCGIKLQEKDKNELGYTPNLNNALCERCFKLKNYNILTNKGINIDNDKLINKINELSQKAIYISDFNQIVSYVKENAKPNDIVLTLGAGTVTKIGPMLCNNS